MEGKERTTVLSAVHLNINPGFPERLNESHQTLPLLLDGLGKLAVERVVLTGLSEEKARDGGFSSRVEKPCTYKG